MDHTKKLQFIQNMTSHALDRMERSPNVPYHDGKMSHDKMLGFVEKMAKHGLQHYDSGGLIGGLNQVLGLNSSFQAGSANINSPTNQGQIDTAYQGAQNALGQQQGQATTLNNQLNQGAANQSQLSNMLMNRAEGNGPSPAQNQLNQATGQNIAQQAALAAGQRGAGANAGLIERQNAQQGAATQQQAVGQAATLGAQEQVAAQNQLQNLSATQVGQGTGAVNSLSQAQQNEQGQLLNAQTAYNNAAVQMQSNINDVNAAMARSNQQQAGNTFGGIMQGASALAMIAKGGEVHKMAGGGSPISGNPLLSASSAPAVAPSGGFAAHWNNAVSSSGPMVVNSHIGGSEGTSTNFADTVKGMGDNSDQKMSDEDKSTVAQNKKDVAALPQPGDLKNSDMQAVPSSPGPSLGAGTTLSSSMGTMPSAADLTMAKAKGGLSAKGGNVAVHSKKQKAEKPDDNYDNDKVPALLSEGEIVIPRHITMHPMAPEKAAAFVRQTLAKKGFRR